MVAALLGLVPAFLVALGFVGSRVLAAAVMSCAGVCSFFLDVALFFVTPLGFDAPLTVEVALVLPLPFPLDGDSSYEPSPSSSRAGPFTSPDTAR